MEPSMADFGARNADSNPKSKIQNPKWSMKNIHRLIVTSATYRQSSKLDPQSKIRNPQLDDPLNRLLARAPRLRVEGEIVRDIALAASGLLNPKVGGASVFPPSPEFLYLPPTSYGPKNWFEDKGENRYRRGLTRSAIAACPSRCCKRLTCRTATFPVSAAPNPTRHCKR